MKPSITQERVRALLDYNADTGVFTWKVRRGCRSAGSIAGCLHESAAYKCIVIRVDGALEKAHRLAWLHVHGLTPDIIDHINRDATDNRLANLRVATRAQNQANSKRPKQMSSPYRGVTYGYNGYTAQISHKNKSVYLGRFKTAEEAYVAWCKAAKKLRGDFAKLD